MQNKFSIKSAEALSEADILVPSLQQSEANAFVDGKKSGWRLAKVVLRQMHAED